MVDTFLCFEDKPDLDPKIFDVEGELETFFAMARTHAPDLMKLRDEHLSHFQFGPRPATSQLHERDQGKPAQIIDTKHILYYGEVETRVDALGENFFY
jgi:hypothetical protein